MTAISVTMRQRGIAPAWCLSLLLLLSAVYTGDSSSAPEGKEERVSIVATVEKVELFASVDHFADGTFASYDAIVFSILSPAKFAGEKLRVLADPEQLPSQSPFHTSGTQCSFTVVLPTGTEHIVFWGALEKLRIRR